MKITNLSVTNFLGAAAVDVRTDAPVQLLVGRNGAGKSSIRDAVALALTADLGRVSLKKEAPALIHDGASAAHCEVDTADGDLYGVTITAGGKITDTRSGKDSDPVQSYVLDAQRFARLDVKERRAFLFGLMGLKLTPAAIAERLTAKGTDKVRIERIAPLLRAGFDAAHTDAKEKATQAKGAWRQVTGETYGSEKGKTWRATVPAVDAAAAKALAIELQHIDVALESWQQQVGKLQAEQQRREALRAKLPALKDQAGRLQRILNKLATDEAEAARLEGEIAKATAAAGTGPRVGLVHNLAVALHGVTESPHAMGYVEHPERVRNALDAYEREHGKLGATTGDPEAAARLGPLRQARTTCANAVSNGKRDHEAALRAQVEAAAIDTDLASPFDAAVLDEARKQADQLKQQRAAIVAKQDTQKALKAQADAAERKTKEATAHHADVVAWDGIAAALGPDGIPAEILGEALGPVNARLAQSALDADWPVVAIDADMALTCGGRARSLCCESEQWRCDAMVAEAVAHLSGARLLVLDRFDVLDPYGRSQLMGWLDALARAGEIDTALVFGTLKSVPANLPDTCAAHWIERGVLGQLKEAA
jgi:hypothetical protein